MSWRFAEDTRGAVSPHHTLPVGWGAPRTCAWQCPRGPRGLSPQTEPDPALAPGDHLSWMSEETEAGESPGSCRESTPALFCKTSPH